MTLTFQVDAATAYTFGAGLSLHAQATLEKLEPTPSFLEFCIQSCNRTGTLAPGLYRVKAGAGDGSDAPTRSYGFSFRLDTLATPSPTPSTTPNGVVQWSNPAGGAFDVAENWDPPTVPIVDATHENTAAFELQNTYAVNVAGAHVKRIVIRDSSIDLVGGTTEATSSSPTEPSLVIGQNGKLHLVSGTLSNVDGVLGDLSGGRAEVDLISGTPVWNNTGRLTIGDAGPGLLTVVAGMSPAPNRASAAVSSALEKRSSVATGRGSPATSGLVSAAARGRSWSRTAPR
ncbi:MAG: hypothetical protein ABIR79_17010 [Candidatus Binatia bacterium]